MLFSLVAFFLILTSICFQVCAYMAVIEFEIKRFRIFNKDKVSQGSRCDSNHIDGSYNPCDFIFYIEECYRNQQLREFDCVEKINRFYGPDNTDSIIFNRALPTPATMFYLFKGFPSEFFINVTVYDQDDDYSSKDLVGNYKIRLHSSMLARTGKTGAEPVEYISSIRGHSELVIIYKAYCLDLACFEQPNFHPTEIVNFVDSDIQNPVQVGQNEINSLRDHYEESLKKLDNESRSDLQKLTVYLVVQYLENNFPEYQKLIASLEEGLENYNTSDVKVPELQSFLADFVLKNRKPVVFPELDGISRQAGATSLPTFITVKNRSESLTAKSLDHVKSMTFSSTTLNPFALTVVGDATAINGPSSLGTPPSWTGLKGGIKTGNYFNFLGFKTNQPSTVKLTHNTVPSRPLRTPGLHSLEVGKDQLNNKPMPNKDLNQNSFLLLSGDNGTKGLKPFLIRNNLFLDDDDSTEPKRKPIPKDQFQHLLPTIQRRTRSPLIGG